jgi:protein-disulfide isomerase
VASREKEKAEARAAREAAEARETAQAKRKQRLLILAGALAVAAVIVVAAVLISQSGGDDDGGGGGGGSQLANQTFEGIPQTRLTLGQPDAPVTLVEFADLQCPFCAQYSTQVLPTLVEKYVKTGKVKMELRLIPILGEDSRTAANWAAAAALQNKTWQFSEAFFADQGQEGSGYVNEDFLTSVAEQVDGLNVDEVKEQQGSEEAGAIVNQSTRQASTAGVSGTPTFRIGRTNQTLEALEITALEAAQFEQQIDRLLGQGGG